MALQCFKDLLKMGVVPDTSDPQPIGDRDEGIVPMVWNGKCKVL